MENNNVDSVQDSYTGLLNFEFTRKGEETTTEEWRTGVIMSLDFPKEPRHKWGDVGEDM